jgi:transposase-like protein
MSRVCPECDGANVRRLSTPSEERTWRNNFYARYLCRDCQNKFWVVRRRTYLTGVTLLAATAVAVLAVFSIASRFSP